jgi:alkyl hydroperoxide reductase subunit AhpC
VEQHAAEHKFSFKVYKDENNVVADRFGAQVTPEVFVIDKNGTIHYHGYIDDSRNAANIKTKGLRMALDSVLAGQPVERAETKAFGCTIKRVKKAS